MTNLLFPGRHLLQTNFQEQYLRTVVQASLDQLEFLPGVSPSMATPISTIVFAVTSANHQFSRYNPIPFHIRAIGVDRFARDFAQDIPASYRIFGIPHYAPSARFAAILIKEIAEQTEGYLQLTPQNCVVLSSTMPVAAMFQKLGYAVLPAEAAHTLAPATPQQLLAQIMQAGDSWYTRPELRAQVSPTTIALWRDFPEVPKRVFRLWHDPLLTDAGSLTDTRNYSTYSQAMGHAAIIDLKYADISPHIVPGRIVDEGCADGALLVRVAQDHPDSDLIGIEITGELLSRCHERHRAGEYGGTFVHFHQRNITTPIFQSATINTTICNSTLHELWSYNDQAATVRKYLHQKFLQTAPGGRLLIRDVVGPANLDAQVWLWLDHDDGEPYKAARSQEVAKLSTFARFLRFAQDFLPQRHDSTPHHASNSVVPFEARTHKGRQYIVTTMRHAVEYISKKDYTENWASEMHEEFAFWNMDDWQRELAAVGFVVLPASHVYTNEWIVRNRWKNRVALYQNVNDTLVPISDPPTTIVLVAEKPRLNTVTSATELADSYEM